MQEIIRMNYIGQDVNIILVDGELLFDASNVCRVLGYERDASHVVEKLDDDEKIVLSREEFTDPTESVGSGNHWATGPVKKNFLTEAGLYHLILRSDKPEAKPFRRWVTHEVLPQIRRTGVYAAPTAIPDIIKIERIHSSALKVAKSQGVSLALARRKAADHVHKATGVDIYQLLDISPKDTMESKDGANATESADIVEKALRSIYEFFTNNRDRFEVKRTFSTRIFPCTPPVWGRYDEDSNFVNFLPCILRDHLHSSGFGEETLHLLRDRGRIVCDRDGGRFTKTVTIEGSMCKAICILLPKMLPNNLS